MGTTGCLAQPNNAELDYTPDLSMNCNNLVTRQRSDQANMTGGAGLPSFSLILGRSHQELARRNQGQLHADSWLYALSGCTGFFCKQGSFCTVAQNLQHLACFCCADLLQHHDRSQDYDRSQGRPVPTQIFLRGGPTHVPHTTRVIERKH